MEDSWSTNQLRALLAHSQDIIIVVDETGTISFVNSAAESLLGYDPDEMVGETAFEFIHEADRNRVFERFIDLIERPGRSTDRIQHQMVHRDGHDLWVESIGSNQADSELDGFVINTRPIDEIKTYEAALERQNARLDEFASVISHDIRNPLNVAQGRIELAREECESDHLEAVTNALQRIEALIEDLLELSRAGAVIGDVEVVELPALVDASWETVDTGPAQLVVETDQSIVADESRLKELLENLFRNAVEHGGASVTITVGDLPTGFYVEDDGRGIPEDRRAQVFEPGYSTTEDGTGFGLNIVEQIAIAHGWQIEATESDAGGARFEITGVELA